MGRGNGGGGGNMGPNVYWVGEMGSEVVMGMGKWNMGRLREEEVFVEFKVSIERKRTGRL